MQERINSDELYHYGVLGMKWGVRRYQRKDGSLTSAGKNRYLDGSSSKAADSKKNKKTSDDSEETKQKGLTDKQKKALIIGAAAVGTGVAIYGGYKLHRLYTGADSPIDPETGFRMINKKMSDFDNLNQVNPGRIRFLSKTYKNKEIIDGSSYNCMLCTTAYDLRKQEDIKNLYCYDRSLGHYWRLRRELSNREWTEIDKRKRNGERLADILNEMKVLK